MNFNNPENGWFMDASVLFNNRNRQSENYFNNETKFRKVVKNRTCCRRYPDEIVIFAIESSGGVPPGDLHTEGTHYGGALKTAKF